MNKLSLTSFAFGLLALLNLILMLVNVNLGFLGIFGTFLFYLPLIGIIFGAVSFFQKLTRTETLFSVLGIVFAIILYSYWIYTVISLARSMVGF